MFYQVITGVGTATKELWAMAVMRMKAGAGVLVWSLAGCGLAGGAYAQDSAPSLAPLLAGSPERGRSLLLQRQETGCVLCHQIQGLPQGGNLGPSLVGLGQRSTAVQARERISDARRFNRETIMPPYLSSADLHNVAPNYRGRTILTPQTLEDIVSYLLQTTVTEP